MCINNDQKKKGCAVHKYMASREMTVTQERWNALTVAPNPFFCFYYILAGHWVSQEAKSDIRVMEGFDESQCIESQWFPSCTAMPPPAVLAIMVAIVVHAPFSFLYHWKYAHSVPPGLARTTHWSRRMDHATIHLTGIFFSYATSGSLTYLLVNTLFNADCIYKQFEPKVIPRRNQSRVGISVFAYTLPILLRGEFSLYLSCLAVYATAGMLFIYYPIGGWSHSVFHLVLTLLPYIGMRVASTLPSSQPYMEVAAQCSMLAAGRRI
mmetsp:Transcript_25976/g.38384  ORF Transcript_25976/g.38384 Transcript_25976/m.38384 type:complete len:266 (+) Transcript_25976:98-895(+)